MTDRTPTPWHTQYGIVTAIIGGRPTTIAVTRTHEPLDKVTGDANAAFVVTAVNAHDAMVAAITDEWQGAIGAMEEAIEVMDRHVDYEDMGPNQPPERSAVCSLNGALDKLRAAIQLAKEPPMTNHDAVDSIYENDDIMAQLGRAMIDKILGLRKQGWSDERIGLSLLACCDTYIREAEDLNSQRSLPPEDG